MKSLGLDGRFFATDIDRTAPSFHVVDKWNIVPRTRSVEYIPAIRELVEKNKIDLIVPLTDLDLRSLARQHESFEKLGATVMVGTEEFVKICRDKRVFSQHIESFGLPAIKTYTLEQFRDDPFFPCFVKPVRGSGGVGAAKINSMNKLQEHVHYFGENLLVQDYIPGREYTIDVYKTKAGQIKAIVPRQRLIVRSGEVEQGITVKDKQLIDMTRKLVNSLPGLWGTFCCQCRRPEGKDPYFYEINPRFGGGATLSIKAGANMPKMLLQDVLGMKVQGKIGQFKENLMLQRYAEDFYLQIKTPQLLSGYDEPIFH